MIIFVLDNSQTLMRRIVITGVITAIMASLALSGCSHADGSLRRGKASKELDKAMSEYYQVIADCSEEIHSIMVVQHGKVLAEKFFSPDTAHIRRRRSRYGTC